MLKLMNLATTPFTISTYEFEGPERLSQPGMVTHVGPEFLGQREHNGSRRVCLAQSLRKLYIVMIGSRTRGWGANCRAAR